MWNRFRLQKYRNGGQLWAVNVFSCTIHAQTDSSPSCFPLALSIFFPPLTVTFPKLASTTHGLNLLLTSLLYRGTGLLLFACLSNGTCCKRRNICICYEIITKTTIFEIQTTANMPTALPYLVTQYGYKRFEDHIASTPMMETTHSSQSLVTTYNTAWRHNQDDDSRQK
jgi:uncharacterized membrane protein YqaE (UPF0057 family)